MTNRCYTELIKFNTFHERLRYLQLNGHVGFDTFGSERYLNQEFYRSREWKRVRDYVILRDEGCDLGIPGLTIFGNVYIHHMNPVSKQVLVESPEILLDPEFLICVSHKTHNAIHYQYAVTMAKEYKERTPFDTCPWLENVSNPAGAQQQGLDSSY